MPVDWKTQLDDVVADNASQVVALRRHLHAHPELSGAELQTSLHLYQLLGKLGLNVRMGPEGCGVIAENTLPNNPPGEPASASGLPTIPPKNRIAFRGDIDALSIQDKKEVPYRSTHDGIMHACGHDAHSAILYGTILALTTLQQKEKLPWPVAWRAIFQPAEETASGAVQMIETGVLDGVEKIFGLHVDPARRTGEIGLRSGPLTAQCDMLRFLVHGQGGHAARPHESKDPIAAAAQLISTLYQFVPRATDSLDAVVLTIGQVRGGKNPNVIPDAVSLSGTLRTLDAVVRTRTLEKIRQVARGVGEITDTKIDIEFHASIPSVQNDPTLTQLVWREAEEVLGTDNVQLIARPSMGSEDFACYLEHVPGVMFRLGSAADLATMTALHTPQFDIDESSLAIGIRVMSRAVIMASQPNDEVKE
ncbi:MAG: amidohydrolase [Planctomycetes bacterium]|nr:amidohydrolase [Planctomycetota bacterium]